MSAAWYVIEFFVFMLIGYSVAAAVLVIMGRRNKR